MAVPVVPALPFDREMERRGADCCWRSVVEREAGESARWMLAGEGGARGESLVSVVSTRRGVGVESVDPGPERELPRECGEREAAESGLFDEYFVNLERKLEGIVLLSRRCRRRHAAQSFSC